MAMRVGPNIITMILSLEGLSEDFGSSGLSCSSLSDYLGLFLEVFLRLFRKVDLFLFLTWLVPILLSGIFLGVGSGWFVIFCQHMLCSARALWCLSAVRHEIIVG